MSSTTNVLTMPPSKPLHIVIIGGSLSGLLTGIPLKRLGHRVTILERSPVPLLHDQGAGVVAGSETLAWIQKHGDPPRNSAEGISVESRERLYLNRNGDIIDRESTRQRMTSWGVLYRAGRKGFDGATIDEKTAQTDCTTYESKGSGTGSYEYGRVVERIEDKGDQVEVTFRHKRTGEDSQSAATIRADFLIAADGPSSNTRTMLLGADAAQRKYAGYVAFRGTVPETNLSNEAIKVFVERFTFFHGSDPNTQILAYTIPDSEGILEKGKRLVNWVWYWNIEEDSSEYKELMTDTDGKLHRCTLPTGGKMQEHVWERQKQTARERLPPQFAELVNKTDQPFVQAITDVTPPSDDANGGLLLGNKAVIVGDALAGFRPHTAASTSQAAFDALMLESVFRGELSWEEYGLQVLSFARSWQAHGVRLGTRSQFGSHPLAA